MEQRARAFWGRIKANRLAYTLTILLTLAVGILIGTVISYGVKGKENQGKASDANPLTLPAPKQLSNAFSQIAKQLEPSVVNINSESVIKNPHRRGNVRPAPGTPDGRLKISLIASSAARAVRGEGLVPILCASTRSDRAC
jgi:S1-C subfamily serine protease